MAMAQTDKNLRLFLPAFTPHRALWVRLESGTIQTIHKIPVAAPSWFVSRTLPAGGHRAGDSTPGAAALAGYSHVVHICPCSLFQHLIRHFEAWGELGMLWKRQTKAISCC